MNTCFGSQLAFSLLLHTIDYSAQYLSAPLAKSGPLDFVGKKVVFYFWHYEKSLGHMFQIQFSCCSILCFLRRHKPKMIFGKTTRVDSDRKCKFHRFCPARRDCNNTAHAILSCFKLQDVFSQFKDKIWKLQPIYLIYI